MSQSPIRLATADALPLSQPTDFFECCYRAADRVTGKFVGEPHHGNFKIESDSKPQVQFRGALYELRKIHFHSESEHIIDVDDPHDLELHFVHAPVGSSVDTPIVVIGVLFHDSGHSRKRVCERAMGEFINSARCGDCVTIRPLDLFPRLPTGRVDKVNWFHYEGSLTSFPYSENVSWFIMKTTAEINSSSLDELRGNAEQHRREVQPLDRRLVVRSF